MTVDNAADGSRYLQVNNVTPLEGLKLIGTLNIPIKATGLLPLKTLKNLVEFSKIYHLNLLFSCRGNALFRSTALIPSFFDTKCNILRKHQFKAVRSVLIGGVFPNDYGLIK